MLSERDLIDEGTRGGPGLDGYAYKGEAYCPECGEEEVAKCARTLKVESVEDPTFTDSDEFPQPIFFGESDEEVHCCSCDDYLYGDVPDDVEDNNDDIRRVTDGEPIGGRLL